MEKKKEKSKMKKMSKSKLAVSGNHGRGKSESTQKNSRRHSSGHRSTNKTFVSCNEKSPSSGKVKSLPKNSSKLKTGSKSAIKSSSKMQNKLKGKSLLKNKQMKTKSSTKVQLSSSVKSKTKLKTKSVQKVPKVKSLVKTKAKTDVKFLVKASKSLTKSSLKKSSSLTRGFKTGKIASKEGKISKTMSSSSKSKLTKEIKEVVKSTSKSKGLLIKLPAKMSVKKTEKYFDKLPENSSKKESKSVPVFEEKSKSEAKPAVKLSAETAVAFPSVEKQQKNIVKPEETSFKEVIVKKLVKSSMGEKVEHSVRAEPMKMKKIKLKQKRQKIPSVVAEIAKSEKSKSVQMSDKSKSTGLVSIKSMKEIEKDQLLVAKEEVKSGRIIEKEAVKEHIEVTSPAAQPPTEFGKVKGEKLGQSKEKSEKTEKIKTETKDVSVKLTEVVAPIATALSAGTVIAAQATKSPPSVASPVSPLAETKSAVKTDDFVAVSTGPEGGSDDDWEYSWEEAEVPQYEYVYEYDYLDEKDLNKYDPKEVIRVEKPDEVEVAKKAIAMKENCKLNLADGTQTLKPSSPVKELIVGHLVKAAKSPSGKSEKSKKSPHVSGKQMGMFSPPAMSPDKVSSPSGKLAPLTELGKSPSMKLSLPPLKSFTSESKPTPKPKPSSLPTNEGYSAKADLYNAAHSGKQLPISPDKENMMEKKTSPKSPSMKSLSGPSPPLKEANSVKSVGIGSFCPPNAKAAEASKSPGKVVNNKSSPEKSSSKKSSPPEKKCSSPLEKFSSPLEKPSSPPKKEENTSEKLKSKSPEP